jgi:hypothetical protein
MVVRGDRPTAPARACSFGLFRQPKHRAYARGHPAGRLSPLSMSPATRPTPSAISRLRCAPRVSARPLRLFACNVETVDDHHVLPPVALRPLPRQVCRIGPDAGRQREPTGDPHKTQLLNLMRLVQGDAETAEIAAAMRLDPVLSFRILRYLNSPGPGPEPPDRIARSGTDHPWPAAPDPLAGRPAFFGPRAATQRLAAGRKRADPRPADGSRWDEQTPARQDARPAVPDWHLLLPRSPAASPADRSPQRPLPIADEIRQALLERSGPYAVTAGRSRSRRGASTCQALESWPWPPVSIRTSSIAPCLLPRPGPAK